MKSQLQFYFTVSLLWCMRHTMMTSSNGKLFLRYWPFVRGIHRWPVNSPHKGQWRGALMMKTWKHFPRYWPFVRGIHRSPVNSPHKGQWRRALMFSLICPWINGWVNNPDTCDSRRHRTRYDVTVMLNSISDLMISVRAFESLFFAYNSFISCLFVFNIAHITAVILVKSSYGFRIFTRFFGAALARRFPHG